MEVAQKVTDIKKQNAIDVTEHIRSRSGEAMELFDDTLAQLRLKLPSASVRELFGGLKIISEIFSPQADLNSGAGAEPVKINVIFGDTSGNTNGDDVPSSATESVEKAVDIAKNVIDGSSSRVSLCLLLDKQPRMRPLR